MWDLLSSVASGGPRGLRAGRGQRGREGGREGTGKRGVEFCSGRQPCLWLSSTIKLHMVAPSFSPSFPPSLPPSLLPSLLQAEENTRRITTPPVCLCVCVCVVGGKREGWREGRVRVGVCLSSSLASMDREDFVLEDVKEGGGGTGEE